MEELEPMLTVKQSAEILGVNPFTIRRWVDQGKLKGYRIGDRGDRRVKKSDLQEFITRHNRNEEIIS
ncbi:helix-turn-helix domain-containing protein [bacterium]|nr:helix-turn-helix domain-containing protein [bacterium]